MFIRKFLQAHTNGVEMPYLMKNLIKSHILPLSWG